MPATSINARETAAIILTLCLSPLPASGAVSPAQCSVFLRGTGPIEVSGSLAAPADWHRGRGLPRHVANGHHTRRASLELKVRDRVQHGEATPPAGDIGSVTPEDRRMTLTVRTRSSACSIALIAAAALASFQEAQGPDHLEQLR